MPHYAHVLSLNRLELDAYIGFYEEERNKLQPVEISFRLYFPGELACNRDDEAPFFNYAMLADAMREFVQSQKFNLIEYMTMALFRFLRGRVNEMGGTEAKLWLQLNKIKAPVPGLKDGASFFHSDLPADATFIPSVFP